MAPLTPRDRRLASERQNMKKLEHDSGFVQFEARPETYPEEYVVTFRCFGVVARPQWPPGPLPADWRRRSPLPPWVSDSHVAHIYLPADYPRQPPQIRLATPVYHPNIRPLGEGTRELEEVAKRVGGIENLQQIFRSRPELQAQVQKLLASYVCVDGIIPPERGGNYTTRSTLYDICLELGQMLMFQRYGLAHGLNDDAISWTKWAEKQGNMLPIDDRNFLDNLGPVVYVVAGTDEVDIQLVDRT